MREQFDQGVVLGGRFKTVSPLNHGSFGMVFVARDLETGEMVAVKCLTKPSPDQEDDHCPAMFASDDRSEELLIHSHIGSHPNIVNLITSFESEHHRYLVMDFCANGDLYEAIQSGKGPLETEHVRDLMLQLVRAVEYMHSKGIYHRDIKPENIFLTKDGSMKIGDFGLATTESWTTEYGVGSDRYMAPEQYDGGSCNGYSPAAADIWAIGICLLNVLFSRNPFAVPAPSDPLFLDYIRDRQSLFDVFPNLSQDTFNVLMQCLALDPSKRSLSGVRDALYTVLSFTTDDESLDEFCMGSDVVPVTVNREPLRTPSISSPQVDGGSFPWAKALQATPQRNVRQLSVIHDTDEMFPESNKYRDPEAASLASALDSGIGMSYKSSNLSSNPISVPMSSSLPISASRAMASVYGKEAELFSKSWSDLWEEEEEEEEQRRSSFEIGNEIERASTVKPIEPIISRSNTPALDIKPASRATSRRLGLTELKSANSRSNSPESFRHRVTSQVKQLAASAPTRPSFVKRSSSSLVDKWAALGSQRRNDNAPPSTPKRLTKVPAKVDSATFGPASNKKTKTRDRSGSWRKNPPTTIPFSNEAWNMSKDWRSPQQPNYTTGPFMGTPSKSRASPRSCMQFHSTTKREVDDIGDLEWVGGWNDLHL